MRRMISLLFLFSIYSLCVADEILIDTEEEINTQLAIGYFSTASINRTIGGEICLNFELFDSKNQCERLYLSSYEQKHPADFLILSEYEYNRYYTAQYDLLMPVYYKSFVAITHIGSELSIFDNDQKIGVLDSDEQIEQIVNIFSLIGVQEDQLDIGSYRRSDLLDQFCNFDVDVVFTVAMHPDSFVRNLNTACDAKIQSVTEALPKNFFQRNRYLYQSIIPKSLYWRLDKDIETLSERYFLAVHKNYNHEITLKLLNDLVSKIKTGHSTIINMSNILDGYQNAQTPLGELGTQFMSRLETAKNQESEEVDESIFSLDDDADDFL